MLRKNVNIQHQFQDTDPIPGQFETKINIPFIADEVIVRNIFYSLTGTGNRRHIVSTQGTEIETQDSPYEAQITIDNYTYDFPDTAEVGMSTVYFSLVNDIIGCIADYPLGQTQSTHWKLDGGITSNQFTVKLIDSIGALASQRRGFLVIMLEFIGYNKQ